jgi:transcriptional regulator with XRE-family HTH domain
MNTSDRVDRAFGERLRRLRLSHGLTQTQLAERAGVGKRSVEDYERGHVPRKAVPALADALGVTPHFLMHGIDPLEVRVEAVINGLRAVEERLDELERLLADASTAQRRIWFSVDATLRLLLAQFASNELLDQLPEPPSLD